MFYLPAYAVAPHQKYMRGWVLDWTWNPNLDILPTRPEFLQGVNSAKIGLVLPPVALDALSFRNYATYVQVKMCCERADCFV